MLDNPLALYKTVVPGSHVLVYRGCGNTAEEIVYNAGVPAISTIGGRPVDFRPAAVFDSPSLHSVYKSGKILLQYDGERLELDFSK